MDFLDCSEPLYFSTHSMEKAKRRIFISIPTPYPVKSPVLRWRPVLPQFLLARSTIDNPPVRKTFMPQKIAQPPLKKTNGRPLNNF